MAWASTNSAAERSVAQTRLAHALITETYNGGMLAAVTADIINAYASGEYGGLQLETLDAVLAPEPALAVGALHALVAGPLDLDIVLALQTMSVRLRMANRLTTAFVDLQRRIPGQTSIELTTLIDAWRGVCSAYTIVLYLLEGSGVCSASGLLERSREVRGYLTQAYEGQIFSVAAGGSVSIPGWAERRRLPRVPVSIPAVLHASCGSQRVTISDISVNGLGLQGVSSWPTSTGVAVEVDGRRLQGTMVWSEAGRAGIELLSPLSRADPLLQRISGH